MTNRITFVSPAEALQLQMADGICNVLFGPSPAQDYNPFAVVDPNSINGYDYKHQAWVENGRYVACGHAGTLHHCTCYGRFHAGERPAPNADIR